MLWTLMGEDSYEKRTSKIKRIYFYVFLQGYFHVYFSQSIVSALSLQCMGLLSWSRIRLQCRKPRLNSWVRKICWRRDRLPNQVFLGFPDGSASKESACNVGDLSSIPVKDLLEKRTAVFWPGEFHGLYSPGEGNGNPLQQSCLENPMDGGAWWAAVHGVTTSRTRLSDFTFTFHFHALESCKESDTTK